MTESQKAFEERFSMLDLEKDSLEVYTNSVTLKRFISWVAGESYGRKQALEDAVALFNQPHVEHFGSSVVEMLEELIK